MRKLHILFLLVLLAIVSSCRLMQPNEMFKTDPDFSYSEFKPSEKEYLIKPYDKLDIKVLTNDGFRLISIEGAAPQSTQTIAYEVEFDGMVKVPTLGRISIAGLTIRQAEQMLEDKYKDYFQSPFVLVKVINRRVILFASGATTASVINITNENFTLIEALAQAGGMSDFSKAYKIKLIRGDLNNPQVFLFNVSDLKDMTKANFLLQANDIIYVEARPRYASKILQEVVPYLSLLTTILLVYGLF